MSEQPIKTDYGIHGADFEHPCYGTISIHHVTGHTPLFMVDYPQQHFIGLTISTATHKRDLSNDWVNQRGEIVRLYMSEVQWARFVSSVGQSSGVPCTLHRYRNPRGGEWVETQMHELAESRSAQFVSEVRERAVEASKCFDEALEMARKMRESPSLKKGDLDQIIKALATAKAQVGNSIGFVVEQAQEAITTSVESAKGEIDAYQQFATQRLGERAMAQLVAQEAERRKTESDPEYRHLANEFNERTGEGER